MPNNRIVKRLLSAAFFVGVIYLFQDGGPLFSPTTPSATPSATFSTTVSTPSFTAPAGGSTDAALQQAFEQRRSDLQIEGQGTVKRVLRDDNKGSRHQKFLLQLDNGLTLLVAHNIDLAPRIEQLAKGDRVAFNGEYEWTERGGVIHWTHHDPGGRHVDGWLRHNGRTYQ